MTALAPRSEADASSLLEKPSNKEELETILLAYNIPLSEWTGEKGTKTVLQLWDEIEAGETELFLDETGGLRRLVHVVAVDIYHHKRETGEWFRLKEAYQISDRKGAQPKIRPHLKGAVGEKIKRDEDPYVASGRGICEELPHPFDFINESGHRIIPYGMAFGGKETFFEDQSPQTYPGLPSRNHIHKIDSFMDESRFDPAGYQTHEKDKTTFFVWEKLPSPPNLSSFPSPYGSPTEESPLR